MTSMTRLNSSASTSSARCAPIFDPISAAITQGTAFFQGMKCALARRNVATLVPMAELSLLVAMAL